MNPTAQIADMRWVPPTMGAATALTPRMYSSSSVANPWALTDLISSMYRSISVTEFAVNLMSPFVRMNLSACSSLIMARNTLPAAPASRGMVVPMGDVIFKSVLGSTISRIVTWSQLSTPKKTEASVFSMSPSMTGLARSLRSIWE